MGSLLCCSETVSLDVWSCRVELEVDCRLVGRCVWKNCKRQSSQSRDQHGLRFAVSVIHMKKQLSCMFASMPRSHFSLLSPGV